MFIISLFRSCSKEWFIKSFSFSIKIKNSINMGRFKQLDVIKKSQIILLKSQGRSNSEIARFFKCHESSVRRFVKKFSESGDINRKTGSGRKRCTSKRTDNKIKLAALKNRFATAPEIRAEVEKATNTKISVTTVQRRLNEMGLFAFRTAKKPLLTPQIRKKRLEWARERENWTTDDWRSVIFSDESKFNLWTSNGKVTVRRRKNERLKDECVLPKPKRSEGVMIWGSITSRGVGYLIIAGGTINGSKYLDIIRNGALPTIEGLSEHESHIIFQDGNATCHRAKTVQNFKESLGIISLSWPGNSPDLNPIEQVWQKMRREISYYKPKNIQELVDLIENVWYEKVNPDYIMKLYESMPNRIKAVIKAKGGYTKY